MASSSELPSPILSLQKSIVRQYHASDAASLSQAANSKAVAAFLRNHFPQPYTLSDAEGWISINQTSPLRNWAIICPTSGRTMGSIGVIPGKDVYSAGFELGYFLGEEFWGRGIMSELVPAFVKWVFGGMGEEKVRVERLWAGVFSENKASQGVLRKSGFQFEGRLRNAVIKDGVLMDEMVYSIIKNDLLK
ncbi:gcn5-related n-acetyltransferase [Colletotrichum truncatum]|uniref:Gcn5-related n-acetyltransferase n=1 Tax=Colletotrichum truncatum TaxID=5467 RepID=A0ACC3ZL66_COLTU|nr:gcn5-related n-acetyltransferase [Colletotrichum truncatum]KAF6786990.1 gcn5-related n-acetyltransferase [Colletotrichum truncatum]